MSDAADTPTYSGTLEVFSLLSEETRLNILLTLGNATTAQETSTFSFNEFWHAVDIDDSGRFNYHLDKLRGTLITKSEGGYQLTYPGILVYKLVESGSFSRHEPRTPAETGIDCFECDGTLTASYEDQLVIIRCPSCADTLTRLHVPPGCLQQESGEHLYRAAMQYLIREVVSLNHGICPNCGDRACHEVVPATDRREDTDAPTVYSSCSRCGYWMRTGFGMVIALEPLVISFYHDHGIDLLAGQTNHLLELLVSHDETVSVNPDGERIAAFKKRLDDEQLSFEIEETLTLTEVERTAVD